MVRKTARYFVRQIEDRWLYYGARTIVLLLFGSILFFPQELELALRTPLLLGLALFGNIVMVLILLGDLLTTQQKSIGSLIYKYAFLTLSVVLAYGLFYYINSTLLDPPGLEFWSHYSHDLKRDVFYFSATTYFTIGYGDITPIGVYAKSATATEAFFGSMINLIVLSTAFQRLVNRSGPVPVSRRLQRD